MRKETFTDRDGTYVRVPKTTARKAFNNGNTVAICPVNARPRGVWASAVDMDLDRDFDQTVNAFEYYNCNGPLGSYAKFFILKNK